MPEILVLYYSATGAVRTLPRARTVPKVAAVFSSTASVHGRQEATHVCGTANDRPVTEEEARLAFALGKRVATVAKKLSA